MVEVKERRALDLIYFVKITTKCVKKRVGVGQGFYRQQLVYNNTQFTVLQTAIR